MCVCVCVCLFSLQQFGFAKVIKRASAKDAAQHQAANQYIINDTVTKTASLTISDMIVGARRAGLIISIPADLLGFSNTASLELLRMER